MNKNEQVEPSREALSYSLIRMAQDLKDYSETVYNRVQGKLEKVQIPIPPVGTQQAKETVEETWPPLYDEIRVHLKEIRKQLSWIADSINRAEL